MSIEAAVPVSAIRVLLADIPGLTAALVRRAVLGQSDIAIVGELHDHDEIAGLVRRPPIDVVVTTRRSGRVSAPCQRLLFGETAVPVIVIGADGSLEVYDRRIAPAAGLDDLLAEIRSVAVRSASPSESHRGS